MTCGTAIVIVRAIVLSQVLACMPMVLISIKIKLRKGVLGILTSTFYFKFFFLPNNLKFEYFPFNSN